MKDDTERGADDGPAGRLEPSGENPAEGASTVRFCANCEEDVDPKGKGSCPKCGRFLSGNVVALVHGGRRASLPPERASQRAALREQVLRYLGKNLSPIDAQLVEDYVAAAVLLSQLSDYLENIGPLTERGTRRAAMDAYLATSARFERLTVQVRAIRGDAPTPTESPGLKAMPTRALEMALSLWERVAAGEKLSEREQGALDVLDAAMRGDVALPPDADDAVSPSVAERLVPVPAQPQPVVVAVPLPVAVAPEPPAPERAPIAPAPASPAATPADREIDWASVPASEETTTLLALMRRFRDGLSPKW